MGCQITRFFLFDPGETGKTALIPNILAHAFVIELHSPVIPMKAVRGVGPALHIKIPRKIKMGFDFISRGGYDVALNDKPEEGCYLRYGQSQKEKKQAETAPQK
jgi:hypothetical protein